jgi:hypothetical protein
LRSQPCLDKGLAGIPNAIARRRRRGTDAASWRGTAFAIIGNLKVPGITVLMSARGQRAKDELKK